MRDEIADRPPLITRVVLVLGACVAFAFLTGCTSTVGNPVTFFADPGKYEFSNCEQLARHRKHWSDQERELRQLMERAEQGTGGVLVNVLAYKADYVTATEELKVIESTARSKNCDRPETWPSNSVIR